MLHSLIQATLGCLQVQEWALQQDAGKILRTSQRVTRCRKSLGESSATRFKNRDKRYIFCVHPNLYHVYSVYHRQAVVRNREGACIELQNEGYGRSVIQKGFLSMYSLSTFKF